MHRFRSTAAAEPFIDRRFQDRRHIQEAEVVAVRRAWNRPTAAAVVLIALSLLIWKWRYVAYGPVWLARAHWADHSEFYQGSLNGISNRGLVEQARNYLTEVDRWDASGNVTAPEWLQPLNVHLDMSWFRQHAPESVDFNPFRSPEGRFTVTWLYYPGCQKAVWKSRRADTDWYSARGRPCFPECSVTVRMAPNLRLTSITVQAVRPT